MEMTLLIEAVDSSFGIVVWVFSGGTIVFVELELLGKVVDSLVNNVFNVFVVSVAWVETELLGEVLDSWVSFVITDNSVG